LLIGSIQNNLGVREIGISALLIITNALTEENEVNQVEMQFQAKDGRFSV